MPASHAVGRRNPCAILHRISANPVIAATDWSFCPPFRSSRFQIHAPARQHPNRATGQSDQNASNSYTSSRFKTSRQSCLSFVHFESAQHRAGSVFSVGCKIPGRCHGLGRRTDSAFAWRVDERRPYSVALEMPRSRDAANLLPPVTRIAS